MATATVKTLATGGMSGILSGDRRQFHFKPEQFSELFKDETPYLTLSLKNRVGGLKDPIFKMFQYENTFMRRYFYNNGSTVTIAAASSGASAESDAVTIDNVTGYGSTTTIDSSFVHKTYEVWDSTLTTLRGQVLLTDDTSTTTAKFKNLTGTAIATVDNDVFVEYSNAQEDGSEAPDAIASELAVVWNQCQQFKTSIQLEGEILYAALRGDNNEFMRLVAEYTKAHKLNIEGAFLKGINPAGTNLGAADTFTNHDALTGDNSKVVRTTYGMIPAITNYGSTSGDYQNIWNFTEGAVKYDDFVNASEKWFQYYPTGGTLQSIAGPTAYSFWSKMTYARSPKDNWVVQFAPQNTNSFGLKIRRLETPNGDLEISKSDALKFEYKRKMLVIDPRHVSYMEYRPTKYMTDIKKDNAYDGRKDLIFTDAGNGITHIKTHQLITIGA